MPTPPPLPRFLVGLSHPDVIGYEHIVASDSDGHTAVFKIQVNFDLQSQTPPFAFIPTDQAVASDIDHTDPGLHSDMLQFYQNWNKYAADQDPDALAAIASLLQSEH